MARGNSPASSLLVLPDVVVFRSFLSLASSFHRRKRLVVAEISQLAFLPTSPVEEDPTRHIRWGPECMGYLVKPAFRLPPFKRGPLGLVDRKRPRTLPRWLKPKPKPRLLKLRRP